ncbi:MAG: hypothetical protein JNK11_21055 [Alphaproteobacteria bacterium]|nr:hypothetical protein [Alphaproteobacteria bacterium]
MFGEYSPGIGLVFSFAVVVSLLGALYMLTDGPGRETRRVVEASDPRAEDGLPAFEFVLGQAESPARKPEPKAAAPSAAPAKAPPRKRVSAFGEEFFHAARRGEKSRDQAAARGSSARAAMRQAESADGRRPTLTRGGLEKATAARASGSAKPSA